MNNINDGDFINKLSKNLRKKYVQEKKTAIAEINAEWSKQSHVDDKHRWLKQDTYHKEILNACIFPFIQQGDIIKNFDYKYIRSSPLSELNLPNVDFLISSERDQTLIFGEAKGSATSPNNIITQYKKRINIIEEKFEYIKTKYSKEAKRCEYVLGIPSDDAIETSKAIHRSDINLILWQVNKMDNDTLSLVIPDTNNPKQLYRFKHNNNELNKTIKRYPTSTAFKIFFNESHPVIKMTLLITISKRLENFLFDDVKRDVGIELDNTDGCEINKTTKEIIDCAVDIGFIKPINDTYYKIKSRYKNSDFRYKELVSKWVERKIEIDNSHAIKKMIDNLQTNYSSQTNTLEPFFKPKNV